MTAAKADARAAAAAPPATSDPPSSSEELEERLSRPTAGVVDVLRRLPGDVIVLGAGGKMGPSLTRMVRRALAELGRHDRVVAVSRWSSRDAERRVREWDVETKGCDLADRRAVDALPDAPSVIFMAGQKFGTSESPAATWAMNTAVPALAVQRYAGSRFVAFSTGNVYPLTPTMSGGCAETDAPGPVGEYANSCLGRERVLQYYAERDGTRVAVVRLNYAVDLRYGVLADVAHRVFRGEPVDVRMGSVNVIWQGDASARAIRCLEHAASPPFVLNVTGLETVSVRALAQWFGERFGREPRIVGTESPDALLSDASRSAELFGPPDVSLERLVEWQASWIKRGGELLDKPTHFESRDGRF